MKYIVLILCSFMLLGCGGKNIRETLGFSKTTPDEFMVIARPELDVPPNFNLIEPNTYSSEESSIRNEAKKVLMGHDVESGDDGWSEAELSLLKKAGINTSDKNIRRLLDRDREFLTGKKTKKKKSLLSSIVSIFDLSEIGYDSKNKKDSQIIDADKEEKRLQKNKKEKTSAE